MAWKQWAKMVMKNEICLVDWPAQVKLLGLKFNAKALGTVALQFLVGDYIQYVQNGKKGTPPKIFHIERWTAGESLKYCHQM